MFDIAPSELLLVAIVALVVIGPKDLPKALRVAGYWVGKARGVARQFRQGFDSMVREAELEEMEKRWASENARIMAEHPSPAPDEVHDATPVMVEKPVVVAGPVAAEPLATDTTPSRSDPAAVGDLFGSYERDDAAPAKDAGKDVAPS